LRAEKIGGFQAFQKSPCIIVVCAGHGKQRGRAGAKADGQRPHVSATAVRVHLL